MKQQFFKHIIILFCLVLFSNSLVAQLIAGSNKTANRPEGKYTNTVISQKIQKALKKDFKEAAALSWFNTEKNTMVRFTEGKTLHRILYAPDGKQIYHISYAEAVDLPPAILRIIKNYDGSLQIQRGIKVEQVHVNIWLVYAQKDNQIVAVRVEEDEVQLFEVGNGDYIFSSSAKL